MMGHLKLAGLSAVLATALVGALGAGQAHVAERDAPEVPKLFNERATKFAPALPGPAALSTGERRGARLDRRRSSTCEVRAPAESPAACAGEARPARQVRHVTHETRPGGAVSVLVKTPRAEFAQR